MVAAQFHPVQISNIEAEQGVLGSLLIDPQAIYKVADYLPINAFFTESHREIYKACLDIHKQHLEVNLLTVSNWLADKGTLPNVGGRSTLANLHYSTVSSLNVVELAELLVEKFVRRQLANLAPEIESKATDTEKPLSWLLEWIEQKTLQLTQLRKAKDGKGYWQKIDEITFERLCKDLEEVEDIENSAQRDWAFKKLAKKWKFSSKKELLDFHAKWLDSRNTTTTYTAKEYFQKFGQSDQDWLIPGFIPNQSVVVLYADGGVGKTRLAFTLAKHCVTGGTFAYDGTDFEAMNTLLIETDQGPRNTSKLLEMQDFLDDQYSCRLTICDDWTANEFGKLRAMLKRHQPKLIIIDSLTSISVDSLYSEKDAEYARPLVRLRHIAKEFNCSFLVIHHSNAGGDMRGSRAIRNTVDEVWKFAKSQNEVETFNTLTIDKTRSRGPGSYKFLYDDDTWGWKFAGRLEDSIISSNIGQSTTNMQRCLRFLQEHKGIAYEASEVAYELNLHKDSVRRDLKRAAGEGLCNTGRSTTNKRAVVYYAGTRSTEDSTKSKENIISDQVIRSDQMTDHLQNNGLSILSPSSDQVINVISQSDRLTEEKIIESGDRFDHLITSSQNPDSTVVSEVISEVITSDQLITCNIPLQNTSSTELVQPQRTIPATGDFVYLPSGKIDRIKARDGNVATFEESEEHIPFPLLDIADFEDNLEILRECIADKDYAQVEELTSMWCESYKIEMRAKLTPQEKSVLTKLRTQKQATEKSKNRLPVIKAGEKYWIKPMKQEGVVEFVVDTTSTVSARISKPKGSYTFKFDDLEALPESPTVEINVGDKVEVTEGRYRGTSGCTVSSVQGNKIFLKTSGGTKIKLGHPFYAHQLEVVSR